MKQQIMNYSKNIVFAMMLIICCIGFKTNAQTPVIVKANASLDTNAFSPGIDINLEINNLESIKQINCRMTSTDDAYMGNETFIIENKYGSLFFKHNGKYKQAYGKLIIHKIELTRGDYARIKTIEFSLISSNETESEKTTIILR